MLLAMSKFMLPKYAKMQTTFEKKGWNYSKHVSKSRKNQFMSFVKNMINLEIVFKLNFNIPDNLPQQLFSKAIELFKIYVEIM